MIERLSRVLVIVSSVAALALQVWSGYIIWSGVPLASIVAFALGWWAGRWPRTNPVFPVILAASPVAPALIFVAVGVYYPPLLAIWIAALFGVLMTDVTERRWGFPESLKPWLILWLLIVAVSWPLVAAREMDFTLAVLNTPHMANSGIGGTPGAVVTWVASVALTHAVGLLWFEWLWRHFRSGDTAVAERRVIVPLAMGALVAACVGIYQAFVDISALSGGTWPSQYRATGTLMDANPLGVLCAMWTAGWWALAAGRASSRWLAAGSGAVILCAIGLWVSGSRTAFAAGLVGPLFAFAAAVVRARGRVLSWRLVTPAAAAILMAVLLVRAIPPGTASPVARLRATLPASSPATVGALLQELWERNRFGTAAVGMITEHPWTGVGVGTFHTLVADYTYVQTSGIIRITQDNAQNWYRHQLAELGVLGSLGWMAWIVIFGWVLLRTAGSGTRWASAVLVKGALVALGLISLVGMPTQDTALTFLFWTFAFWYFQLVGSPAGPLDQSVAMFAPAAGGVRRVVWGLLCAAVVAHAALTLQAARGGLRVPARAVRADWRYEYGFRPSREGAGDAEYRYTGQRAVSVVPREGSLLHLKIVLPHHDADVRPVAVRLRVNGRTVVNGKLRTRTPETFEIPVGSASRRVMIETEVDRTDAGRGLGLQWSFSGETQ